MLKKDIENQIIIALRAHDKSRLDVLRFVLSNIKYAEIEKPFDPAQGKKQELTDEEVIALLQKEVKKRTEAVEIFKKGGRTENIPEEEKQIAIIKSFLPEQLGQVELEKIVDEAIKTAGPNPQIGQIIGAVMAKVKGQADGSRVASIVSQKLH